MLKPRAFLIETDHVVELSSLVNAMTEQAVSDAEVTVTLRDQAGAEVAGASWPQLASPVPGVAGSYRATLPASVQVQPAQWLEAVVVADAGVGLKRTWRLPLRVEALS